MEHLKIPPHSLEAEQSVLGSILISEEALDIALEIISVNDFFRADHRYIFEAAQSLHAKHLNVDAVTVFEELVRAGVAEEVGGLPYLSTMARNTPTASNVAAYASIIRDRAVFREMIGAANEIADLGFNPGSATYLELLNEAEEKVFSIALRRANSVKDAHYPMEEMDRIVEAIRLRNSEDGITGLRSGFGDLDKLTSGFQNSDLIIIAGRPSMGKSTFAMNICENFSLTYDRPTMVFSLEMPSDMVFNRSLSALSTVPFQNIKTGRLSASEWKRVEEVANRLKVKNNLIVDDASGLTPAELRSRARRAYRKHGGLSAIMVDYLQLMRGDKKSENRTLEIGEISQSLKALAKELNVPVIALSQLNRGVENRSDKRPLMSDLRESGAIEQDADVIMFLYRDEVYNKDRIDNKGTAEVLLRKQRNGPTGDVFLTHQGQYMRFSDSPQNFSVG